MIVVRTKEELKQARKKKLTEFEVRGKLAGSLVKSQKISKLSKGAAISLTGLVGAGIAAAPVTGGVSLGASSLVGATALAGAGVSSGVIIAAMSIGGILVAYALFKDYDVEINVGPGGTKVKMKRKRK